MEYIPRTLDEVHDYLGYMFLLAPDFDDPDVPGQTLETAFAVLYESLTLLRGNLGENGHKRLCVAADYAKMWLKAGDADAGCNVLQHMHEYLRLKKFKTDEPVVDDSRFQS